MTSSHCEFVEFTFSHALGDERSGLRELLRPNQLVMTLSQLPLAPYCTGHGYFIGSLRSVATWVVAREQLLKISGYAELQSEVLWDVVQPVVRNRQGSKVRKPIYLGRTVAASILDTTATQQFNGSEMSLRRPLVAKSATFFRSGLHCGLAISKCQSGSQIWENGDVWNFYELLWLCHPFHTVA